MRINTPASLQRRLSAPVAGWFTPQSLYRIFLLLIVGLYWLSVYYLERIDLDQFQCILPLPLPIFLNGICSLFAPQVLRHFIPVFLGWLLANEIAANLLVQLYELPGHWSARQFLFRLIMPIFLRKRFVIVKPQTLNQQRKDSAQIRAGGPGQYVVPVGHAAVTESNGRFCRTLDMGLHTLKNFEYIHAVFDLRSQHRSRTDVQIRSREGLTITADVGATFRVSRGGKQPTPQNPYPYDTDAVRDLAYGQLNLAADRITSWENYVLAKVTEFLKRKVMEFPLNALLEVPGTDLGAHLTIRLYVERMARAVLRKRGIELIRVRIGHFNFSSGIADRHITYWNEVWNRAIAEAKIEGEATAFILKEVARAEAEIDMINDIIGAIREAKRGGHGGAGSVIVALRLIESLERVALKSQTSISVPGQMLQQLQSLHQQLLVAGSEELGGSFIPPEPRGSDEGPLT